MYRLTLKITILVLAILGLFPIAIGTMEAGAQTTPTSATTGGAENPLTIARIDSITWQLYQSGDWDGVLSVTRKALNNEIDFYYLRVRAGKAAFEKKQYRLAVSHFTEAYRHDSHDDFVNYWYYYSLWLDGREDEADALYAAIGKENAQRLGIKPRPAVSSVLAEGQYSANRDADALASPSVAPATNPGQGHGRGQGYPNASDYLAYRGVYLEQTYKGIGVDHRVTPTFHLFHGVSHLDILRTHIFTPANASALLYEGKASQLQYFVQGRFWLSPKWSMQAGATLIGGWSDGAYYSATANGMAGLVPSRYTIGDRQLSAAVTRSGTWLEPSLGFTLGSVGDYMQAQATGRITLYPLRNANLTLTTQFDMHHDASDEGWKPVVQQHLSLKTGPVWWIAEAAMGDIRNFTTLGGYVVYNQPETIKQITGLSLYVPLFSYKLDLTLRYRLQEKEGMDFDYSDTNTFNTIPYRYYDDAFLLSVRWHW